MVCHLADERGLFHNLQKTDLIREMADHHNLDIIVSRGHYLTLAPLLAGSVQIYFCISGFSSQAWQIPSKTSYSWISFAAFGVFRKSVRWRFYSEKKQWTEQRFLDPEHNNNTGVPRHTKQNEITKEADSKSFTFFYKHGIVLHRKFTHITLCIVVAEFGACSFFLCYSGCGLDKIHYGYCI